LAIHLLLLHGSLNDAGYDINRIGAYVAANLQSGIMIERPAFFFFNRPTLTKVCSDKCGRGAIKSKNVTMEIINITLHVTLRKLNHDEALHVY
jgi:hypothetical protein